MNSNRLAALIAASATAVALSSAAIAADPAPHAKRIGADDTVKCYGVNSCKGTSDCKTASNECKGQNGCKGQGFKAMTVKACKAAGGSLTEPK